MKINYFCLWVSVKKKNNGLLDYVSVCERVFLGEGALVRSNADDDHDHDDNNEHGDATNTVSISVCVFASERKRLCVHECVVVSVARAHSHNGIQLKCYCSQWTIKKFYKLKNAPI